MTTGAVKLGGIGSPGSSAPRWPAARPRTWTGTPAWWPGARTCSTFRPAAGAGIEVAAASGALLGAAGQDSVAAPLGPALALLPEDLGERAMLGDAGANALGAMLGRLGGRAVPAGRIALLAGIAGLTAASEKVSFTKVIARTPA